MPSMFKLHIIYIYIYINPSDPTYSLTHVIPEEEQLGHSLGSLRLQSHRVCGRGDRQSGVPNIGEVSFT